MKEKSSAAQRTKAGLPVKQVSIDSFLDRIDDVYTSIARRAYEIFDHEGMGFGRELEHWLRAESELFHPLHFVIRESDNALTIRAEVPGFTAKDLEISVEPRRLAISGTREAKKEHTKGSAVYCEQCSDQIFRVLDLPAEVDPSKTTATLKDGILELEILKAATKKTTVEIKTA
jgi:HSP20 family molecular chaperone IbpA